VGCDIEIDFDVEGAVQFDTGCRGVTGANTVFICVETVRSLLWYQRSDKVPYAAVRVMSTSGSLTPISTSAFPIFMISMPNDNLGFEYAPRVTEADISFTSNIGVNDPPPKPVAELESGFWRSAVSCAVLGIPAETPKSTVASP